VRGYALIRASPASRELSRREAGRYNARRAWKIRTREMVIMNSRNFRIFVVASSLGLVAGCRQELAHRHPRVHCRRRSHSRRHRRITRPAEQSAQVKPRTSILGAWKLNRDESDDPRKKMQDARGADNGRGGGGGGGRGGVRMGIPGMGGGPYGGGRRGGGGGGNESDEDRQQMQQVLGPTSALTVAEAKKDVEIDVFDDQQRKTAIFTDGRKLQKTKDSTTQEIAAHWDGNRLVTDEKTPKGQKMSRMYELSYDGTQLYETLQLTRGRSSSQISIRYVYDQAKQQRRTLRPRGHKPLRNLQFCYWRATASH